MKLLEVVEMESELVPVIAETKPERLNHQPEGCQETCTGEYIMLRKLIFLLLCKFPRQKSCKLDYFVNTVFIALVPPGKKKEREYSSCK